MKPSGSKPRCRKCAEHRKDVMFFSKLSALLFDLLYDPKTYTKEQRTRVFKVLALKVRDHLC